jgi:hypothetical protein
LGIIEKAIQPASPHRAADHQTGPAAPPRPPPFPTDSLDAYEQLARTDHHVPEEALGLAYAPIPDEE